MRKKKFKLNETEKRVLLYLQECKKAESNPVYRSVPQIAKEFDMSKATIFNAIRVLQANNQIYVDGSVTVKPKIFVY